MIISQRKLRSKTASSAPQSFDAEKYLKLCLTLVVFKSL